MKTPVTIMIGALLVSLSATAQQWVGNLFALDTIVEFQGKHMPKNPNLIKCRMEENTFYFIEQQGFQDKDNHYQAVIHAFSTDDYGQAEIVLPLPDNKRNKELQARNLWIYDFSFDGDYLLLTTQDELILYKRNHSQNYLVESTYPHPNLFMGYLNQGKINFFEEDHDRGFKWFQQDLGSDSAFLVRELSYEAPHITQIQPNRYISHNQQSVFFLSTRNPRMEVYDLDGHLTDTVRFDLPKWKKFEDEYIRKSLSVPYGIERIYATKDDIYSYSYPKVAMPLCEDILLLYMQFDSLSGKSELQYALHKKNGLTTRYLKDNHEDSVYTAARFPFTLFHGSLDKGNATSNDRLVQLTYKTDIPWQGKRHADYLSELNLYFAKKEPALAYKVMLLKPENYQTNDTSLFTEEGKAIPVRSLPAEKSILLLHRDLECSGCVKALYTLMNETGLSGIHVGHVYPHTLSGIQAFEIRQRLRQHLHTPFTLYYETSSLYTKLHPSLSLQEQDFPCLILYQKGNEPQFFRIGDLFSPNSSLAEFKEEFLRAWHSFVAPK